MRSRREVAIVLGALKSAGFPADDAVKEAIENGLKQVRREKYYDRHKGQIIAAKKQRAAEQ